MMIRCAILVFNLVFVSGQYYSPCPEVFSYQSDGSGVFAIITVPSMGYATTLLLRANFTIATRLNSNNVGRIEPLSNSANLLQGYNSGVPLQYRVDFPVTNPLPRPTSITVNGNVLCYGPADSPGPGQYVTTTSLQHTLYLKGASNPGFFNEYEQPQQRPQPQQQPRPQQGLQLQNRPDDFDFFGQLPNDVQTQIFTIDQGGNRQGSWNSANYPTQQRPEYEIPITRPPPPVQTRPPEPQYYPEMVTRPQPPPPPPVVVPSTTSRQPPPPPPSSPIECGIVSGGNEHQPLIFNGQSYARGDWPWLVAIYKRKDGSLDFICSGTLVSDRHVVTAAHCMQQKNTYSSNRDIVVKVGVYNLEDWGDDITVTRTLATATIHDSYNATSLANDILVLTFERSVEFNTNIRPACLWNGNADLSRIVGASGVVAGWGQNELGPAGRGEPRVVRVPVVSTAVCRASRPDFHKLTSQNTLCAGDRKGSGPCLGDSGGGLYLLEGGRWRLRGVVSLSLRPDNGDSTCNLNEYIVFTDSAKYLNWIQRTMQTT